MNIFFAAGVKVSSSDPDLTCIGDPKGWGLKPLSFQTYSLMSLKTIKCGVVSASEAGDDVSLRILWGRMRPSPISSPLEFRKLKEPRGGSKLEV